MNSVGASSWAGARACTVLACALVLLAGCGSSGRSSTPTARPAGSVARLSDTADSVSAASASATAAATASTPVTKLPLSGRVITIDPGHDGGNFTHPQQIARLVNDGNGEKECDTTGTAAPDGYRETDFNWSVALRLRALLLAAGARVVLTRHSNTGVGPCITERAAIGNRAHSNAAISIHADGGPPDGSGFAILIPAAIPSRANQAIIAPSRRLAVSLRTSLLGAGLHASTYDGVDGLAPRTDLGGLNLSRVPKVFVEVANMQNAADEAPMERPTFRRLVARALLAGLERFLQPPGASPLR
ncbi:MAG: N-acetylmuramoyl-L-alanine amidase [Solirubrobacteraceae bacterium]